jgi:predicted dehydrogenase
MGIEYTKVLKSLKCNFTVIGRGEESARHFESMTGISVIRGGVGKWLNKEKISNQKAIVVVSENELGRVTLNLLKKGIRNILVEKPGGSNLKDIRRVFEFANRVNAKVYIGYNRRFYASVTQAKTIIKNDGGLLSLCFDFTERSHIIAKLKKANGIKNNWLLHNSTHVIDLAFFLAGWPKKLSTYLTGGLSWHPSASVYTGAGITENGVPFSYHADWEAPGGWGIELMTKGHKLILRPLEKLQVQKIGDLLSRPMEIDNILDTNFKPGIYKQVESYLNNNTKYLCKLSEQIKNIGVYKKIGGIEIN